jgi:predicted nucleic acid-binding protein
MRANQCPSWSANNVAELPVAIVYFDSSAFVKLVVEEEGSDIAAALWDGCDAAVASRLAYSEVRAALAAAGRDHRLDVDAQRQAEAAWEEYWAATRPVELSEPVAFYAGELAGQYALRGADAIHLASALVIGVDKLVFAAWDRRLRAGIEAAGIRLAPADETAKEFACY